MNMDLCWCTTRKQNQVQKTASDKKFLDWDKDPPQKIRDVKVGYASRNKTHSVSFCTH